jgi:hypothetical protein
MSFEPSSSFLYYLNISYKKVLFVVVAYLLSKAADFGSSGWGRCANSQLMDWLVEYSWRWDKGPLLNWNGTHNETFHSMGESKAGFGSPFIFHCSILVNRLLPGTPWNTLEIGFTVSPYILPEYSATTNAKIGLTEVHLHRWTWLTLKSTLILRSPLSRDFVPPP